LIRAPHDKNPGADDDLVGIARVSGGMIAVPAGTGDTVTARDLS